MQPRDTDREVSGQAQVFDTPVARMVVRESLKRTLLPDLRIIRSRGAFERSVLSEKIRSVCSDAHQQGLHAEQVIVLIKEMWAELRAPLDYEAIREQNERLSTLVRLTIDEYYGAPPGP